MARVAGIPLHCSSDYPWPVTLLKALGICCRHWHQTGRCQSWLLQWVNPLWTHRKPNQKALTTILLALFYVAVLVQATHTFFIEIQNLLFNFRTTDFCSASAGLSLSWRTVQIWSTPSRIFRFSTVTCHGNVLKGCSNTGEVMYPVHTGSPTLNYKGTLEPEWNPPLTPQSCHAWHRAEFDDLKFVQKIWRNPSMPYTLCLAM